MAGTTVAGVMAGATTVLVGTTGAWATLIQCRLPSLSLELLTTLMLFQTARTVEEERRLTRALQ